MHDNINYPSHYVDDKTIEPLDVIEDWRLPHHLACVVKYVARWDRKGDPLDNLDKAIRYLQRFRALVAGQL